MLKTILAFTFIICSSFIYSQQFLTTKTPFFKAKKSSLVVLNNLDEELIKMPLYYKKNRDAKGSIKTIVVDGENYFITKHKGIENVFNADQDLVATMMCKKKFYIHLIEDNALYHHKRNGWFSWNKTDYINDEHQEVVIIKPKNRRYALEYIHEYNEPNKLLLALCLHHYIETQHKKQSIDDNEELLNALITQN